MLCIYYACCKRNGKRGGGKAEFLLLMDMPLRHTTMDHHNIIVSRTGFSQCVCLCDTRNNRDDLWLTLFFIAISVSTYYCARHDYGDHIPLWIWLAFCHAPASSSSSSLSLGIELKLHQCVSMNAQRKKSGCGWRCTISTWQWQIDWLIAFWWVKYHESHVILPYHTECGIQRAIPYSDRVWLWLHMGGHPMWVV